MQEIEHKKGKIYYTMGEVAEMFDVKPSLLRYWEQEFDILKPHRNKKGNRLFTPKDVDNIRIIYHLLKERKMKIEVARKYLKDYRKEVNRDAEITERLMNIRALLLEIKQDLAFEGERVDEEDEAFDPFSVPSHLGIAVTDHRSAKVDHASATTNTEESLHGFTSAAKDFKQTRPPFEEQVLFDIAVPLELMQRGAANGDEGFESAKAAFTGQTPLREDGEEELPVKTDAIEQTLF